jgi:hypothetical protein
MLSRMPFAQNRLVERDGTRGIHNIAARAEQRIPDRKRQEWSNPFETANSLADEADVPR